ncbi:MAG: iron-sulfur cluster assembly accessory protein [Deltaproteobacteria bacterium]|nr:MAG: iron-sulfur cluster assembly accessory protein [Deltaproteobacteria bacterium]
MIRFTLKALDHAKQIQREQQVGQFLRISVRGEGCRGFKFNLNFSTLESMEDFVFDYGGVIVLVDMFTMMFAEEIVVDYEKTNGKEGFRFFSTLNKTCNCPSKISEI